MSSTLLGLSFSVTRHVLTPPSNAGRGVQLSSSSCQSSTMPDENKKDLTSQSIVVFAPGKDILSKTSTDFSIFIAFVFSIFRTSCAGRIIFHQAV
ncbi:hypothetical protein E4T56_gene18348 [Termitomyces sp. T112]|nr:hypothetical protein E4T56_gene18348 [Termitomyces sp. T112]